MYVEEELGLNGEIGVLYPYFNTDDLALIYNMSRGWMARKIVASGVTRRSAGETRALPQVTSLPYDVYTVYDRVRMRTGGGVGYEVACEERVGIDTSLTSEEIVQLYGEVDSDELEVEEELGVDEELRDFFDSLASEQEPSSELVEEPSSDLVEEPTPELVEEPSSELVEEPSSELVEEHTDLINQLRQTKDFNTMTEAYDFLTDVTRELGKQGVYGDIYDAEYVAKLQTTPPIEMAFSKLSDLKRTVKNGVDGAEWDVLLRVSYLPSYTETERLGTYLTRLQQNEQVFAGRFRTEHNDRISVRVSSNP